MLVQAYLVVAPYVAGIPDYAISTLACDRAQHGYINPKSNPISLNPKPSLGAGLPGRRSIHCRHPGIPADDAAAPAGSQAAVLGALPAGARGRSCGHPGADGSNFLHNLRNGLPAAALH